VYLQIPKRGKIYSMNEANRWNWDKPLQEYVTALQTAQVPYATSVGGLKLLVYEASSY
jgi:fructose-1,6-bisphosphatase